MFIRIFSDLHTEFEQFDFPHMTEDKQTVCVLAGDIGVVEKPDQLLNLLQRASVQFAHVIYVFGNHEFYKGGALLRARSKLQEMIDQYYFLMNVHIIENQSVVIDGVAFIGSTLWTDFGRNPLGRMIAEQYMNDYRHIRHGTKANPYEARLSADDLALVHADSRRFIFDEVKNQKASGNKTVVVVHHGVSELSISEEFKGDKTNVAFTSELSDEILDTQPDVIIHGHVHRARQYTLGETRVYVNPRGYPGERSGFDPLLRIEV